VTRSTRWGFAMSEFEPARGSKRGYEWLREGGQGLPPDPNSARKLESDEDLVTHLFTCVNCGRRLCSPPGPPTDMTCGNCGRDYVCHTFDPAIYSPTFGRCTNWKCNAFLKFRSDGSESEVASHRESDQASLGQFVETSA